jgi:hypothetical protein
MNLTEQIQGCVRWWALVGRFKESSGLQWQCVCKMSVMSEMVQFYYP